MRLIDMEAHRGKRLEFGHFIDRIFWFVLTAAIIYCASQMREMGRSVEELNKNMALALYQITETRDRLNKIDSRIDKLEERKR
jgi:large-conductance mechanosensitive channel